MREGVPVVTTPYMIVVQHDRNFRKGFDLVKVRACALFMLLNDVGRVISCLNVCAFVRLYASIRAVVPSC